MMLIGGDGAIGEGQPAALAPTDHGFNCVAQKAARCRAVAQFACAIEIAFFRKIPAGGGMRFPDVMAALSASPASGRTGTILRRRRERTFAVLTVPAKN
jgi:hypothetical protein